MTATLEKPRAQVVEQVTLSTFKSDKMDAKVLAEALAQLLEQGQGFKAFIVNPANQSYLLRDPEFQQHFDPATRYQLVVEGKPGEYLGAQMRIGAVDMPDVMVTVSSPLGQEMSDGQIDLIHALYR